jgi:hypothetical protein
MVSNRPNLPSTEQDAASARLLLDPSLLQKPKSSVDVCACRLTTAAKTGIARYIDIDFDEQDPQPAGFYLQLLATALLFLYLLRLPLLGSLTHQARYISHQILTWLAELATTILRRHTFTPQLNTWRPSKTSHLESIFIRLLSATHSSVQSLHPAVRCGLCCRTFRPLSNTAHLTSHLLRYRYASTSHLRCRSCRRASSYNHRWTTAQWGWTQNVLHFRHRQTSARPTTPRAA